MIQIEAGVFHFDPPAVASANRSKQSRFGSKSAVLPRLKSVWNNEIPPRVMGASQKGIAPSARSPKIPKRNRAAPIRLKYK